MLKHLTRILLLAFLFQLPMQSSAQDWWTKTKKEAIPSDLKGTILLFEKFKTKKLHDAPPQAFIDKEDREEHPWIKKTNEKVKEYNEGEVGPISKQLYEAITGIHAKKTEDIFGWLHQIEAQ